MARPDVDEKEVTGIFVVVAELEITKLEMTELEISALHNFERRLMGLAARFDPETFKWELLSSVRIARNFAAVPSLTSNRISQRPQKLDK